LWVLGLGAAMLALAYGLFRFDHRRPARTRGASQELPSRAEAPLVRIGPRPRRAPSFGPRTLLAQLLARTRLDMAQVFLSPGYIVLVAIAVVLSVANMWRPTSWPSTARRSTR